MKVHTMFSSDEIRKFGLYTLVECRARILSARSTRNLYEKTFSQSEQRLIGEYTTKLRLWYLGGWDKSVKGYDRYVSGPPDLVYIPLRHLSVLLRAVAFFVQALKK